MAPLTDSQPRLRIRLYKHGLGDCHLLRFARPGGDTFNVLIDCGIIDAGAPARETMQQVAADIADACGKRLDLVVMTHEHWDHASGFSRYQAREIFDGISIGEVWYGWTEDPDNAQGARLRQDRAAKVSAVAQAHKAFAASGSSARADSLGKLLRFFGPAPEDGGHRIGRTREAFEYPGSRAGAKVRYCDPGKPPMLLAGVDNVRVYVLGPPTDEVLIRKSAPTRAGKEVYEFGDEGLTAGLEAAFARLREGPDGAQTDHDCPFPASRRSCAPPFDDVWNKPCDEWRKIDDDWSAMGETLALNLDSDTNNTSVVLAFEFTDTGKVFLFPGDAQVGSWLSWQKLRWQVDGDDSAARVTANDLLRRTVFYKVGHHGSHNATLRELGLEQMKSPELVAFIPVIKTQAEGHHWAKIPFEPLVTRLAEKTGARLLQSDLTPSPQARDIPRLVNKDLYFELSFD